MRKHRDRIYSVLLALVPIQAQLWYAALFPQGGWGVNIPWLSLCRCSPTEVGPALAASVRFRPSADTRWYRLRGYCVTLGSYAHLCTTTWRRISIETVSQQSSIMDSPIWLNMMTPWHGSAFCIIVRRAGLLLSQQDFEWRWSVPLFQCLTVLEFSFILFDLCLLITFFNFIMNYVPIVTFWIFTYHKIWILSIMFCFIWSYWIIYFLACL